MKIYQAIFGDAVKRTEVAAAGYQMEARLAVLQGFYLAESMNQMQYHGEIVWNKLPALTGSRTDLRIMIGRKADVENDFYIDIRTQKAPLLVNPKEPQLLSNLTEYDLKLAAMYGQLIETGRYGSVEIVE